MKLIPLILSASIVFVMASCTSPIARRIERNPDIYNSLSPHHQQVVQQGRVEEGMTKKAVFLSWGKPDRAAQGSKNGRAFEQWSYAGYEPNYVMAPAIGPGYWGSGSYSRHALTYDRVFYEPMMTYVPYEAARVEFINGIVTTWSKSR